MSAPLGGARVNSAFGLGGSFVVFAFSFSRVGRRSGGFQHVRGWPCRVWFTDRRHCASTVRVPRRDDHGGRHTTRRAASMTNTRDTDDSGVGASAVPGGVERKAAESKNDEDDTIRMFAWVPKGAPVVAPEG